MAPSTPANLVENSNNLPLAMKIEHWTLSANEDKYLWLINGCKSKGYTAKNHFRKHMLSHIVHVLWDTTGHPKGVISKPRIQNYWKFNALVLSDEMARKQKELKQQDKKWLK